MTKVAIFTRMMSRPVPRVLRGMRVAEDMGYNPIFCGAFREKGLSKEDIWSGYPINRVGRPFPMLNGKRPFLYILSILAYNYALLRFFIKQKPKLIHASDFDTMPASVVYARLTGTRLVYNIHDNIAQRHNFPRWINGLLNVMEGLMILFSHVSLVPEDFRRDALPKWCRKKVQVVRNTPEDPSYSEPTFTDDNKIIVFYGGWLDWGRGLNEIIALAEMMPQIQLRIAGEGSQEITDFLINHPRVTFLGYLEYQRSLEETKNCHFIPALYQPITIINRYAASNKIAEALALGRPLILNTEIKVVETLGQSKAIIAEPFGKIEPTGKKIKALFENRAEYIKACHEARDLYNKYYRWETAHKSLVSAFTIPKNESAAC